MTRLPFGRSMGLLGLLLVLALPGAGADKPCGPATPRHSRSEPLDFPHTDLVSCHSDRTIVEDSAFFSGEFRSGTGRLTTRYLDGGKVSYTATLDAPGYTGTFQGTATVGPGHLSAADGATRLAFTDGGVDLTLGGGARDGWTEEFFYDPGGTVISPPNDEGSGCDLSIPGLDKEAFIKFFYALKRAVVRDNREAVASMVQYPLDVHLSKQKTLWLKRPSDLVSHYSQVFTPCVRKAVLQQKISRVFCRSDGAMLGNGQVWIAGFGEASPATLRISAVNVRGCR